MSNDSFFVVIEGIDGAGKTSIARALNNILRQTLGEKVLLTEEPHNESLMGTEIRSALRRERELKPVELAQAFALNRSNHLKTVIDCHLQREHAVVICDRYLLSSLVYQTRDDITMEDVYQINRWARAPDLTIVLQVSAHVAYQRMDDRGKDARELFENDLPTRLKKYRAGVELLRGKGQNIITLEGDGELTVVFNDVLDALENGAPPWLRIQPPLLLG
ncbi:MAG: dTMP kinase [Chloroflexota bacterium]|nr:dTMP kinase [Chloroflexota bacterium]MDE2907941.1 dTMP kinase [Chloroflexota bacterium]